MNRKIYVRSGLESCVAVEEDGALCEFFQSGEEGRSSSAVYAGKVGRIVPGMNAAFVDIGQSKAGFLPLSEKNLGKSPATLRSGDKVMVQIRREAQGTKGALLSRDVTLCGNFVMLMPMNDYVGISSKIADTDLRERLGKIGKKLSEVSGCGIVMRSNSADAKETALYSETDLLQKQWLQIKESFRSASAPSLVHKAQTVLEKLITDFSPEKITELITDDRGSAEQIQAAYPAIHVSLSESAPQWSKFEAQRRQDLGRIHRLGCGGTIVVDICEAMTVIDVNTAANTGSGTFENTVLETNLQACGEIARLLRMRNISGIIIIDMIDMAEESHRSRILEELKLQLSRDRIKTVIHGMTSLGLIEMTRRRSDKPVCCSNTENGEK